LLRLEVFDLLVEQVGIEHPAAQQRGLEAQFIRGRDFRQHDIGVGIGRRGDLSTLEAAGDGGIGHRTRIDIVLNSGLPRNLADMQARGGLDRGGGVVLHLQRQNVVGVATTRDQAQLVGGVDGHLAERGDRSSLTR
jgi:hypothetical protein